MSLIDRLESAVRAAAQLGGALADGETPNLGDADAAQPAADATPSADDTQPMRVPCLKTPGCELANDHKGGCQIVVEAEEVKP